MESIIINGTIREDMGKKSTKAARYAGEIPCVVYGGEENLHFSAPAHSFKHLIYTPDFKLAEIHVDGKVVKAIVKDIQFHPVTDKILHIDFVELIEGKPIKVEIPIQLSGQAIGALQGGVVQQKIRRILVKTTPQYLMDAIQMDVSELDLGHSLRLKDIGELEGIEILSNLSNPVASVEVPRALKSAEAASELEEGEEGEEGEGEGEGGEEGKAGDAAPEE